MTVSRCAVKNDASGRSVEAAGGLPCEPGWVALPLEPTIASRYVIVMADDRSDDDLVKLLYTPAIWLVRGAPTPILAKCGNLQMALVKSSGQPRNRVVRTITKMPNDEIVIHPEQISRLWKLLKIGDRTAPLPTGGCHG
jgi:hypothetical protein